MVGPPGAGKTMLARRLAGRAAAALVRRSARVHRDPFGGGHAAGRRRAAAASGRFARRITRSRTSRSSAAARFRARARSASRITACCSSTRCRSSAATCSTCCASRSKKGASPSRAPRAPCRFPARFVLVAAMNPCPCGYRGDPQRACRCTPQQVAKYRGRLSGPLLDRIDLIVDVQPVAIADLTGEADGEPSAAVRARVLAARDRQLARPGRAARLNAALQRTRASIALCVSTAPAGGCSNDRRSACTSPRAAFIACSRSRGRSRISPPNQRSRPSTSARRCSIGWWIDRVRIGTSRVREASAKSCATVRQCAVSCEVRSAKCEVSEVRSAKSRVRMPSESVDGARRW